MSYDNETEARVDWRFTVIASVYNTKRFEIYATEREELLDRDAPLYTKIERHVNDIKERAANIADIYSYALSISTPAVEVDHAAYAYNIDEFKVWTVEFHMARLREPTETATMFVCRPMLTCCKRHFLRQEDVTDAFDYGMFMDEGATKNAFDYRNELIDRVFKLMAQIVDIANDQTGPEDCCDHKQI